MIIPRVGLKVAFVPATNHPLAESGEPGQQYLAFVTGVTMDGKVGVCLFDAKGKHHGAADVPVIQDDQDRPELGYFVCSLKGEVYESAPPVGRISGDKPA